MTIIGGVNVTSNGCPIRDPSFPLIWPSHTRPLNIAIFILLVLYEIITLLWFYHRRNQPFLRSRPFGMILFSSLGGWCVFVAGPLRDAIGRDVFSCDAYLWITCMALPCVACPMIARLIQFYYKAILAQKRNEISFETLQLRTPVSPRRKTLGAMLGGGKAVDVEATNGDMQPTELPAPTVANLNSLKIARKLAGPGFTFLVAVGPLTPMVIAIGVRSGSVPFYNNGCYGCVLFFPETILYVSFIMMVTVFALLSLYRLRKLPDPLFIIAELVVASIGLGVFCILGIAIDYIEPTGLHGRGIVTWSWIVCIAQIISHSCQCTIPVYMTYKMSYEKLRKKAFTEKSDAAKQAKKNATKQETGSSTPKQSMTVKKSFGGVFGTKTSSSTSLSIPGSPTNSGKVPQSPKISTPKSSMKNMPRSDSNASFSQNTDDEFFQWVSDPVKKVVFAKFLVSEFSPENLRFWSEAVSWRDSFDIESIDSTNRDSRAKQIYNTFVARDAPLEINIPFKMAEKLHRAFASDNVKLDQNVFNDAVDEIYHLMSTDSFARFKLSNLYCDFVHLEKRSIFNRFTSIFHTSSS